MDKVSIKMSWEYITEHEKDLDRKITASAAHHFIDENIRKYKFIFNLKKETIDYFMEVTGVAEQERDFIISRIEVRIRAYERCHFWD